MVYKGALCKKLNPDPSDATNLEVGREVKKMLQITCDQLNLEKEEEKK
jgi:hypothetical protein